MTTANETFRDYEIDGNPASGAHKVDKSDARSWGTLLESEIATLQANFAGVSSALLAANNLSDLVDKPTARANLGVAYGKQSIWVPSSSMRPTIFAPPTGPNITETATNFVDVVGLDFANGGNQWAQFMLTMPKSWDQGTLTALFWWFQTAAGAGNTKWGINGVALSSGASADQAFGTIVRTTSTGGTSGSVYKSPESAAITIAGSLSDDCVVAFQIFREGSSDTLGVTARLLGVRLLYNTDAANDT